MQTRRRLVDLDAALEHVVLQLAELHARRETRLHALFTASGRGRLQTMDLLEFHAVSGVV